MANALLDFVMSLVRDPDAAARYAADPAGALADAHLADVTSADVQNLIPVVSESLSMAVPSHSFGVLDAEPVGNVWASGAATAAFDAFDDQLPASLGGSVIDTDPSVPLIVDDIDAGFDVPTGADLVGTAESPQFDELAVDDVMGTDAGFLDGWVQPDATADHGGDAAGFDIFD